MTTYSKLYWLTRLDSLQSLLIALAIITLISACIIIIVGLVTASFDEFECKDEQERRKTTRQYFYNKLKLIIPFGLFCIVFVTFIPSTKEAIFIVAGGKTIDYVVSDTTLTKIPGQASELVSEFLDNQIKELKNIK